MCIHARTKVHHFGNLMVGDFLTNVLAEHAQLHGVNMTRAVLVKLVLRAGMGIRTRVRQRIAEMRA